MSVTAFHDGRKIKAVWWANGQGGYAVGYRTSDVKGAPYVTRIAVMGVEGQGAFVPWLEVFAGNPEFKLARVNLANVEEVVYEPPA